MNAMNVSIMDYGFAYDCLRKAINEIMKAQNYIIDHDLSAQCERMSSLIDDLSDIRSIIGAEIDGAQITKDGVDG